MHDPLTVAFEIRRPWPRRDTFYTEQAARTGDRWKIGGPFWTVAGHGLYWPSLITVWHHDPSNYDHITCHKKRWRLHVHHWRIQISPLQQLRRRLFTRCTWCGGRHTKADPVNLSHQWDRPRGRWWQGERGLYHRDCSGIAAAHATCVCHIPDLEQRTYGRCARCGRSRVYGTTPARLARARELAAIPPGQRSRDGGQR